MWCVVRMWCCVVMWWACDILCGDVLWCFDRMQYGVIWGCGDAVWCCAVMSWAWDVLWLDDVMAGCSMVWCGEDVMGWCSMMLYNDDKCVMFCDGMCCDVMTGCNIVWCDDAVCYVMMPWTCDVMRWVVMKDAVSCDMIMWWGCDVMMWEREGWWCDAVRRWCNVMQYTHDDEW